ncbi:MAG: aspartate--tRNA(Asn) ligase [Methanobacterium formicicum]|uniref:Aspartate--tRNA(Asp/Asn) ligase n=2 Tax=Methanobacteriaceae TaxID=2159 RepID=A0A843AUU5_METFO|nr:MULTISPECIES: aspartate--tRNA(Asn) ligase [Methanobacterium]KUK74794.1 MAG: Aspartate--tRNA ligase [Methanobacterium sp. 42_16]MBF4474505.1 aspartate--tRNA(Asn) ligase [Methanobacterium formicicum]MDD4810983.1 aspartate--tRNA(Asn) ligase [Methanobacterium formicicum]MDG3547368.1 aspartate--tRNA(Asn) ligase [Methanobacterium formicicum]
MTDSLGDWKRTHYSQELDEDMDGKTVTLMGWVHEIRDLGGIIFVLLRDRNGITQITAPSKKITPELMEEIRKFKKESVIAVKGTIQGSPKAPGGVEVIPEEVKVLNESKQPLPLDPTEKVRAEIDTRLDSRYLDLRKHSISAIFKIKSTMLHSVRIFLEEKGFMEVNTPKLVGSATEGGTELFPITYFEREAFLGQSPQLYKQMMMATGLDKVFEIAPIFRAEEHDTLRHLNEVISIDAELAFADQEEAMELLEKLVHHAIKEVKENCQAELEDLGVELEVPELPFPRLEYDEVIDIVNSKGVQLQHGEDLSRAAEKALGEVMDGYYFITNWPSEIKPFYVQPHEDEPEKSYAFDLMYRDLEISSGATRVHQHDLLVKQIKSKGLNPDSFQRYLAAFEYGMPPHAGWGLGAERFTMCITGMKNIRETVLFPRDRRRLTP